MKWCRDDGNALMCGTGIVEILKKKY